MAPPLLGISAQPLHHTNGADSNGANGNGTGDRAAMGSILQPLKAFGCVLPLLLLSLLLLALGCLSEPAYPTVHIQPKSKHPLNPASYWNGHLMCVLYVGVQQVHSRGG
jgi:hypothetical protein